MTLFQNPVFVTEQRLARRAGMPAAIPLAALIGLGLLGGQICHFAAPEIFRFASAQAAGKTFYGWLLAVEMLVLVVGGFRRISRALVEERTAGLWDSNRLTPLTPAQLVAGYWLGAALWHYCLGAVLAAAGLVLVVLAGLPLNFWLETQVLTFALALLFGLVAVLVGLTAERSHSGLLLLLLLFGALLGHTETHPRFLIMNFLLPVCATVDWFHADSQAPWDWPAWLEIFGLRVPAVLFSLALQALVGLFLWRAAVRKTARPFEPMLQRQEAVGLFALLMTAQHGLIWGRGRFGGTNPLANPESLLPLVQGATLLFGIILLAGSSPRRDHVRIEALRNTPVSTGWILSRSSVTTALALAVLAGVALLAHFGAALVSSSPAPWQTGFITIGNLVAVFVSFSLWLEICRLRFPRRAVVVLALGLFVLHVTPLVLGGLSDSRHLWRFSMLSPGILALAGPGAGALNSLTLITLGHLAAAAGLAIVWWRRWQCFLEQSPSPAEAIPGSLPIAGK